MKKILGCIVALLLVAGCQSKPKEELQILKIGVMPAVDTAPIFVAIENGYFEELGLKLEADVYTNAMNRQAALQSGELDGAMTDVIALVNNVDNGFEMKVTLSTDGVFPILTSPKFEEKSDIKVGMMEVSVTNYLSDEYLSNYTINKEYVNEIPARLELVAKGGLDMVVVPEPVASQGEGNGLKKTVFESKDNFSPDVMIFTDKAIKEKNTEIKKFHEGYNKAVTEINKNPELARNVLVQKLDLKEEVSKLMVLPTYHEARVPDESFVNKIIDWNNRTLNTDVKVGYKDLVDPQFTK
ncbi:MAG: ABC transporter substrate-binding protein [Erysipelothrix sp.]